MNGFTAVLSAGLCMGFASGTVAETLESVPEQPSKLTPSVAALIDGYPVPYAWFLQEFRSTFYQYGDEATARREAFDRFLDRMLLYRAAQAEGVHDEPEIRSEIETQIGQMRAFMEYQLAMAEARIVVEAYLARRHLGPEQFHADDEALAAHIRRVAAVHPEADQPLDSLPPEVQTQIRKWVEAEMRREAIESVIAELRHKMEIESNFEAVDATPYPEIIRD